MLFRSGYMCCEYDCCVYFRVLADGSYIFLALYVNDMLVAAKSMQEIVKLKSLLSSEFDMKDLGAAKKILGIEMVKYGYLRRDILRRC